MMAMVSMRPVSHPEEELTPRPEGGAMQIFRVNYRNF
jgi:hypothetical protein